MGRNYGYPLRRASRHRYGAAWHRWLPCSFHVLCKQLSLFNVLAITDQKTHSYADAATIHQLLRFSIPTIWSQHSFPQLQLVHGKLICRYRITFRGGRANGWCYFQLKDKLGWTGSKLQLVNGILLIAIYFLARIVFGFTMSFYLWGKPLEKIRFKVIFV